jgi:hypothetical protein
VVAAQQQPTSPLGRTLSRGGGGFGRSGEYVRSDYEEKIAIATFESLDLVKHMTQVRGVSGFGRQAAGWQGAAGCARMWWG